MRINQVEEMVQISKKNIRFYEDEGLLKISRKAENGYRDYTIEDVEMLKKIKLLRHLSIPIDEILKLQKGFLTLEDCMSRHVIFLNRERNNIEEKIGICKELAQSTESFQKLDTDKYLSLLEEMKKEGVRFMDVEKNDKRKKSANYSAIAMTLLMIWVIFILYWAQKVDPIPLPIIGFIMAMPVLVIVGVLLALRQRMNEIEKGEEDAASKY